MHEKIAYGKQNSPLGKEIVDRVIPPCILLANMELHA